MKKELSVCILSMACLCPAGAQTADINKVWEYCPAPGQFVHELPSYAQGDGSEQMAEKCLDYLLNQRPMSLGGFGGYITVGFGHRVMNIAGEKDLLILGNAFEGSAEPGIVMVSADTNADGLPNDEWYELAGSEYNNPATIHDYEITYTRPAKADENVAWTDNQGRSGVIEYMGAIHPHPHFPEWTAENTLTLKGTCLPDNGSWDKAQGKWVMKSYAFGYADNHPNKNTEGCSFDIGWAVTSAGEPANLEGIDFVRIYTGVNQQIPSGAVGELSTEVIAVKDLHPLAAGIRPSLGETSRISYANGRLIAAGTGEGRIRVFDMQGNLLEQVYQQTPSAEHPLTLPEGIYIVKAPGGVFKLKVR